MRYIIFQSKILKIKQLFIVLIACFTLTLFACQSTPRVSSSALDSHQINIKHRDKKDISTASDNYTLLGAGYIANKNYEKAMLKLKKAVKLDSDNARAYNYLGILYWKLDEPKLAVNNFKKSHDLSPYDSAISHNYALFLCSQKQFKVSTKFFNKVFSNSLYDRLSQAYGEAGECALTENNIPKAEKNFKKSLKLNVGNFNAKLGMAKVFYKQQKYKLALYYYQRFVRQAKQTPDSLWLGINIQRKMGDKNKLASYTLELKNLYPDSDETLLFIDGKQTY